MEPVFDDALEFRERQIASHRCVLVVARGTILLVLRMMTGKFSGAEKFLVRLPAKNPFLINEDRREPADDRDEARAKACDSPRMLPFVIAEIAFVALGDLLLGSSRRRHGSVIKKRHDGVPDREHHEQK